MNRICDAIAVFIFVVYMPFSSRRFDMHYEGQFLHLNPSNANAGVRCYVMKDMF
jgi:hypothetical protein